MVENNVNDANAETLTEQKKACSAKIKEYFKTLPKRYFITAFSGLDRQQLCGQYAEEHCRYCKNAYGRRNRSGDSSFAREKQVA